MQIPKKKELKWKRGFMKTLEKNSSSLLFAMVAPRLVKRAKRNVARIEKRPIATKITPACSCDF